MLSSAVGLDEHRFYENQTRHGSADSAGNLHRRRAADGMADDDGILPLLLRDASRHCRPEPPSPGAEPGRMIRRDLEGQLGSVDAAQLALPQFDASIRGRTRGVEEDDRPPIAFPIVKTDINIGKVVDLRSHPCHPFSRIVRSSDARTGSRPGPGRHQVDE